MYTILAILILIASVLLIGIVLIQKSKGGGLAANVNNYNQFMGGSRTTDFVEKATWALAGFICLREHVRRLDGHQNMVVFV